MFPSFSQRGRLWTERSSRALALGDSIASFHYDCDDDDSMTGASFADETSISNLDDVFQRSFAVDSSAPDLVTSSLATDCGSSSLTASQSNASATGTDCKTNEPQSPFGVPLDDLFRSFEEHLTLQSHESNRRRALKKKQRSRRRGLGSCHSSTRSSSDASQATIQTPKRSGQRTLNVGAGRADDQDMSTPLRRRPHSQTFDYLPATRQNSLRQALLERSVSQRSVVGSPSSVSQRGESLRRKTQDELKAALFREFGVKSEANVLVSARRDDERNPSAKEESVGGPNENDDEGKLRRERTLSISFHTPLSPSRAFPSAA